LNNGYIWTHSDRHFHVKDACPSPVKPAPDHPESLAETVPFR